MAGMKRFLSLPVLMLVAIIFMMEAPVRSGSPAEAVTNSSAPGRLQVYVLDVGRGQSVLVISPTGKAALIDAGPSDAGSRVLSQLRRRSVRNLEVVVATQAGADYIGGMRRVAASSDIIVKSFVDSAQPWKTDTYQQMLAAVQGSGIPVIAARRGLLFDLGGGARLDILNPAGDGAWLEPAAGESRENANSVVVRLLYREFVMLIMSGAGAATASRMIEARQNLWAPFLMVGDGGSRDSLSEKMLSIVQPKFAIISTGANSAPAQETIERLKAVKAEIYRTDTSGEISITSDGRKHEIAKER
jgi:beta-lactamase superfamily II metal-dependent hydrolase